MKYKIEKDIPRVKSYKKTSGLSRPTMLEKYGFILKLENGDSLICNRGEMGNFFRFCKKSNIGVKSSWVDKRDWYKFGYAKDGKYRVWFYPSDNIYNNEEEDIRRAK